MYICVQECRVNVPMLYWSAKCVNDPFSAWVHWPDQGLQSHNMHVYICTYQTFTNNQYLLISKSNQRGRGVKRACLNRWSENMKTWYLLLYSIALIKFTFNNPFAFNSLRYNQREVKVKLWWGTLNFCLSSRKV